MTAVHRWGIRRNDGSEAALEARRSLVTWGALLLLFAGALHLGPPGISLLVFVVAVAALGEYVMLLPRVGKGRGAIGLAALLVPPLWIWMHMDWRSWFIVVAPVALAVAAGFRWRRGPRAEISLVGPTATLVLLSYVVGLALLPEATNPGAGPMGWVVWTILLTELNDMAQSFWGRWLGRRRLAPVISPGKTIEGFVGGLGTTAAAALVLAPVLTPWPERLGSVVGGGVAVVVGLAIAVLGLLGDLRMSTMKRFVGVKDSGRTLPGQGGVLDRIDSLLFTAPAMFWIVWWTRAA